MEMIYRLQPGAMVPAAESVTGSALCRRTPPKERSERKLQRRLAEIARSKITIPPSLDSDIGGDPGGVLDQLGIVSSTDFWRWYHAPDGPEGVAQGHMGDRWGELWNEFLQTDELVLAGAVPLVLHKRAQITGVCEERKIEVAELKALQKLRQRLEHLEPSSLGGLVMTICGRVHINVQHGEFELAMMHLQAMRRLIDMQPPASTVWLCSVWTDLRVVSSTGSAPLLERHMPEDWKARTPALPQQSIQACQRSAMSNMRSLGHAGSERFLLTYGIFRQLHELEITDAVPVDQAEPPMETLYGAVYDCCSLDAESTQASPSNPFVVQSSLLAICLKLCAWEKASRFVPRGGEIERSLLQKAKHLLGDDINAIQSLSRIPGGANANAMLWMLLTLTATAYMFQRDELDEWISRLRAVSSVSTASAFQRSLKGWPMASWWCTHALRRICNDLAPKKGQWRVLSDEPEPVPLFTTGLRLKLLVIGS